LPTRQPLVERQQLFAKVREHRSLVTLAHARDCAVNDVGGGRLFPTPPCALFARDRTKPLAAGRNGVFHDAVGDGPKENGPRDGETPAASGASKPDDTQGRLALAGHHADASIAAPGSLGAAIGGQYSGGKLTAWWDVRASGLTAAAIVAGGSLLALVLLGDPMHKPGQFVAALFAAYVAGLLTNAIVGRGRLLDALREKENYRLEMERVAAAKSKCEEMLVRRRVSSTPSAKKKGG
jgi:hypothetical protein